jgi:hypothetical protein
MANTKDIFFEGEIDGKSESAFTKNDIDKRILEASHGDHVTFRIFLNGYLGMEKNNDRWYVIGAITSHSARAEDIIDFLAENLKNFSLMIRDCEWTDIRIWEYDGPNAPITKLSYIPGKLSEGHEDD